MTIEDLTEKLIELSPQILTGIAIAGVGLTAYLVGKTKAGSDEIIDEAKEQLDEEEDEQKKKEIKKEAAKKLVKTWAPAAIAITLTVTCIVASNYISTSRQAALASIVSMSQSALLEYKDVTKRVLGEDAADKVNDAYAMEMASKKEDDLKVGDGDEIFYEELTGQVFVENRLHVCNLWKELTDAMQQEGEPLYLSDFLCDLRNTEGSALARNTYWDYDLEKGKKCPHLYFKPFYTSRGTLCHRIEYDRDPDSLL